MFRTLCNPDIFRTLSYSPLWYILKNKHIQNPTEYLRWSILLMSLSIPPEKRPLAWNGLMYQLFFRTRNLLILLYSLLLFKSMTYFFAICFVSQSLVMRYRTLNNPPHRRYLTEFWNFGYGLRVKRKEKYLYIRKYNNIKNNIKKRNSGK